MLESKQSNLLYFNCQRLQLQLILTKEPPVQSEPIQVSTLPYYITYRTQLRDTIDTFDIEQRLARFPLNLFQASLFNIK